MTKQWLTDISKKDIHVVPTNDIQVHVSKPTCWCEPRQNEEEPSVWVHRVFSKEYPEHEREQGS